MLLYGSPLVTVGSVDEINDGGDETSRLSNLSINDEVADELDVDDNVIFFLDLCKFFRNTQKLIYV